MSTTNQTIALEKIKAAHELLMEADILLDNDDDAPEMEAPSSVGDAIAAVDRALMSVVKAIEAQ